VSHAGSTLSADAPSPPPIREELRRWRIPSSWISPFELMTGLILLAGLGIPLWYASPMLLPVRVYEGPMVQQAHPSGLTLVWYSTRPVKEAAVAVETEGGRRIVRAKSDGTRNVAEIDGLSPGQAYAYEILHDGKPAPDLRDLVAHTAPPAGAKKLRFIVFGDSGRGYRDQYALAAQMVKQSPELIVHTGDLVYSKGQRDRYADRFFTPYRRMLAQVAFWPCLGNHDVKQDGGSPYREVFALPENGPAGLNPEDNYWFDAGPARFVVIDSNATEATLRDVIAPWMREVCADADRAGIRWKFAVWHHPNFTVGRYWPGVARMQTGLAEAAQAAGIDVVFNGHDHSYQRTKPVFAAAAGADEPPAGASANGDAPASAAAGASEAATSVPAGKGVVYIVSGAGGGKLYEVDRGTLPDLAFADGSQYSFTVIEIDGERLSGRQIGQDGSVIDEFGWTRTDGAVEPQAAGGDE
jgi:predicted phosphodiesterase